MADPDRPTVPPDENTTPRPSAGSVDQWIMKNLNDLRDDVRDLGGSVGGLSTRIGSLEKTIMRAVYGFAGVTATIVFLWTAYQVLTRYYDISFVPKATQPESSQEPVN